MPGCPTSTSTTISGVWVDFRNQCGPTIAGMSVMYKDELYVKDLGYYVEWADDHGIVDPLNDSNYAVFRKWFAWKLMYGTNSGGNLPVRLRTHVGLSCAPCPYSTECNDIRAEHMLGNIPAIQTSHGNYYMKVEGRGTAWGFVCTYSGCPYLLDTGKNYFYV